MAERLPVLSWSIRRGIARATSATSRCCSRARRPPSWRAIASRAPALRKMRASSSWTTAFTIPRWSRTLRCWWSTEGAASATGASSRPGRCARRSMRNSRAPTRSSSWEVWGAPPPSPRERARPAFQSCRRACRRIRTSSPPYAGAGCLRLPVSVTRRNSSQLLAKPASCLPPREDAERGDLVLMTTEKDLARLFGEDQVKELAARAKALPVTLAFEDEETMKSLLLERLARARRQRD